MPRSARLDVLGAVQHVMTRGIEGQEISADARGREALLERQTTRITPPDAREKG